jgi:hypothetical protein
MCWDVALRCEWFCVVSVLQRYSYKLKRTCLERIGDVHWRKWEHGCMSTLPPPKPYATHVSDEE